MKEDSIQYIKDVEEIKEAIKDLTDSYKYHIDKLKELIKEYFSENLQNDETTIGRLKRNQIRKELLEFANK